MDESKQQLERAVFTLLCQCGAFYACVINAMQISFSNATPTACVRFNKEDKTLEMVLNPEFFGKLTDSERVGLVWHEALHVLYLHVMERANDFPEPAVGNIACDLAVNHLISLDPSKATLPQGGALPDGFGLPGNKSADYYYAELMKQQPPPQQQQQQQQQGGGEGDEGQQQQQQPQPKKGKGKGKGKETPDPMQCSPMDDHGGWTNTGMSKDAEIEILKKTLERAKERAAQMGSVGKVPAEVEESLKTLEQMKTRQWHREFARFAAHHTDGDDRVRSWSRRNKRYGLWEAGTKCGPNKKIIIGVDTSGSMCEEEICQALAECKAMLRCSVEAEVWFFDTQVNRKYKLKKNGEYDVGGRGGTDFNDFLVQAQRKKPDAVVVFTDGDDGRTVGKQPKVPVLWVLTQGDRSDFYSFGRKVVLDK